MNDMSESDQSDLDRKAIAEEPARSMQRVVRREFESRESRWGQRKARVGQGGVMIDCPRWTCGTVETVGPYGSGVIYGFDTTADGRP